ncbi:hypothetical protein DPMN_123200 [Dreissena polymorpha]|uniref:Uncharacterized protein n=1 Tax=Dreissena polymorpha TaxID=45954 RepID=A0A9D4JRA9_DREPO|nr:hypothetical protein DPMN_123200 [Dreissena polymorpha]
MSPHESLDVLLLLGVVDVNKMTSTQCSGLLSVTPNLQVTEQSIKTVTKLCN